MQYESMTFDDIEHAVNLEIKLAEDHNAQRATKRTKSWDNYYGRPLGNEVKGRSQFITREIMDTIEWMMPYFIRMFASGDPKVTIEIQGQDAKLGKALMQKIQKDLGAASPNQFLIFYQWFKDALVSDTAFVKLSWQKDFEQIKKKFDALSYEQMQQLSADRDIQVENVDNMEYDPETDKPVFIGVKTKIKKIKKDNVYVENTPHWEFIADPKSVTIDDDYGKGHKTEVMLDFLKRTDRGNRTEGEPYFQNLEELEAGKSKRRDNLSDGERQNYLGDDTMAIPYSATEKDAKAPIDFIEWNTKLDVDGNGYLEDIIAYVANGYLLRWEINQDGFIPFVAMKPIIDCYKFFGISYTDLLIEIQNLKTMLFRRILDNFDFQNAGRWLKDPNAAIDTYALLNNIPGSVITGKIDGLKDISPQPFNPVSLSILEYVDTIKENRTGVTKYNQGQDSNSLNKTARGIGMIQNAAMQRLELVARIFAEIGLKEFYKKYVLLMQKNLSRPFIAKIAGEDVEITPEMIQGEVVTKVNMGITASVGAEEAQKVEHVMGLLLDINERYPGLLTPEKVHSIATKLILNMGFQQTEDFIVAAPEYLQQAQQAEQSNQQMQQQMQQMQEQMMQMELQIKQQDANTKAEKVQVDAELGQAEIEQKEQDSQRDMEVDLLKILSAESKQPARNDQ